MNQAGFWHGSYLRRGNLGTVPSKIRALSLDLCSQNLDLENFATASRWFCQQYSLTVKIVDHTCDNQRVIVGHIVYYMLVDCNPLTSLL